MAHVKSAVQRYDAILEDEKLRWLGDKQGPGCHRVVVTVFKKPKRSREEIRRILDAAYGAWDTGKSIDEIDAEIEAMRAEWDRPWDDPEWDPSLDAPD